MIFSAHRRLLPTPASASPFYLRFFASDLPYRTRVVFAEVDAILIAVSMRIGSRLGGEIVVIHNITSHCIQRAHIVFHGCIVVSLNSLGRLLLNRVDSLRGHGPNGQLGQVVSVIVLIPDFSDADVSRATASIRLALLRLNTHGVRRGEAPPSARAHRRAVSQ